MWEESIEAHIKGKYPALGIESNNRSVVPSRNTRGSYLEIDIFIPELSLGIEANGETYHAREKYTRDRQYSTEYSDEMYKENYCASVGIELIHVWSSQDMGAIQRKIDNAIERRLADPATREWRRAHASSLPGCVQSLLVALGGLLKLLSAALLLGGVVGSSLSFMDVVLGGSGESGGRFLLPSFLAGVVGVCLWPVGDILPLLCGDEEREAARADLHNLPAAAARGLTGCLVSYISFILMSIGGLAVLLFLMALLDGWLGDVSVGLAIMAVVGLTGLLLHRLSERSR